MLFGEHGVRSKLLVVDEKVLSHSQLSEFPECSQDLLPPFSL